MRIIDEVSATELRVIVEKIIEAVKEGNSGCLSCYLAGETIGILGDHGLRPPKKVKP